MAETKIDVDSLMENLSQKKEERLIEEALAIHFDRKDAMTSIVINFLRARKFEDAEQLAEGNA